MKFITVLLLWGITVQPGLASQHDYLVKGIQQLRPGLRDDYAAAYAYSIRKYAIASQLDPRLVAAVIATESRFDCTARGTKGEVGLMQLLPRYHGYHAEPDTNIAVGTEYLSSLNKVFKTRYKGLRWIELYNRGPSSHPKRFPYYRAVMANYRVFGGRDDTDQANAGTKGRGKGLRRTPASRKAARGLHSRVLADKGNT